MPQFDLFSFLHQLSWFKAFIVVAYLGIVLICLPLIGFFLKMLLKSKSNIILIKQQFNQTLTFLNSKNSAIFVVKFLSSQISCFLNRKKHVKFIN